MPTPKQFNAWLQGVFDERLRTCLSDMRAAGYTSDEVAAVVLTEESDAARFDVLAQVQRIMADPFAPSHSVN